MKYLLLILLCTACGGSDLKKVEDLEGFRVLGALTATPEVAPGATVSDIQLLFSDVGSGGRPITGTATGCIDPGISLGAEVDCSHDPGRVTQPINFDTGVDDETSGFFTGRTPAIGSFTIPSTIFLGRSEREQFNGVGYIIIFDLNVPGGKAVQSFKRILATTRTALNSNPTGGVMLLNGSEITTSPGKDDIMSVSDTSQESYEYINLDGETEPRREEYQVAWYVSEGELDKPKSFVAEDVKFLDDKVTGPYLQIAVIRDERGGIQFLSFPTF